MLNRLRLLAARFGLLPSPRYPYPAFDVTLRHGIHLHLVASIHMGNPAMSPLPARLRRRLQQARALIVEADITRPDSDIHSPSLPLPLAARLDSHRYEALCQRCHAIGLSVDRMDTFPLWRCALMLQAQQAQRLGLCGEFGIDFQLLQRAHEQACPVIELEGAHTQLALLNQLPDQGRDLLDDTLQHWHDNARLLQCLIGWWLAPPAPETLQTALPALFSPSLAEVLMTQRNRAWCRRLTTLPAGEYVVAVGALHLFGDHSLPELLAPHRQQ